MKEKILISVFNDISKDARVQRQIQCLSQFYNLDLLCYGECNLPNTNIINISNNSKPSYVQYIFNFIKIAINDKYCAIYGNDYYSCLPMLFICLFCDTKLIYDAHEVIFDSKELRDRIFSIIEKIFIKHTDLVICASKQRAKLMKEYYKLKSLPTVIRNISKLQLSKLEFNQNEELVLNNNKIKVVYAGVLSKGRKLDLLVKTALKLGDRYSIIIIGNGDQTLELQKIIKELCIKNVFMLGAKNNTDLGNYISKCDIGYLYYPSTNLNNIYCAPNKIYEYTSLGLPILSNNNVTMTKEITDNEIGKVFIENINDKLTIDEMCKNIIEIYDNIDKYKDNAYRFSYNCSWDLESETLYDAVREVVD